MASVSWQYPRDQLIALRRQNAGAGPQPVATGVDLARVNFRYDVRATVRRGGRYAPSTTAAGLHRVSARHRPGRDAAAVRRQARGRHLRTGELPRARQLHDRGPAVRRAELRFGAGKTRSASASPGPTGGRHRERQDAIPKGRRPRARWDPRPAATENDARPLTGEPAAPMRLRPEAARVTRLSRKVLAGLGLVASVGLGGALIYALQTRHGGNRGQELYSTDNRTTPDGLAGLPRTIPACPELGPPLPGDLGRPILNAQNGGQPVPNAGSITCNVRPQPGGTAPGFRAGSGAHRALFSSTGPAGRAPRDRRRRSRTRDRSRQPRPRATAGDAFSAQDRQLAFLNQTPDKRTVSPGSRRGAGIDQRPFRPGP